MYMFEVCPFVLGVCAELVLTSVYVSVCLWSRVGGCGGLKVLKALCE